MTLEHLSELRQRIEEWDEVWNPIMFNGDIHRISESQFLNCNNFIPTTTPMINSFEECIRQYGIHVLACYVSPHVSQRHFGIYINQGGVNVLANYFKSKLQGNPTLDHLNQNSTNSETQRNGQILKLAKKMLLRHELGHYAMDYALTKCDSENSHLYHEFKRIEKNSEALFVESMCNANVARQSLKIRNTLDAEFPVKYQVNLNEICENFMDNQPAGYTEYREFVKSYSNSCVDKLQRYTGMSFDLEDFKEKIKDKTIKNIPLYVVMGQ
jgi:hypothetical protein